MPAASQRAAETSGRPRWSKRAEAELSSASLAALLADEIPAIRIRNFATAQECAVFAEADPAATEWVGLALHGPKKAVDKAVKGLALHR